MQSTVYIPCKQRHASIHAEACGEGPRSRCVDEERGRLQHPHTLHLRFHFACTAWRSQTSRSMFRSVFCLWEVAWGRCCETAGSLEWRFVLCFQTWPMKALCCWRIDMSSLCVSGRLWCFFLPAGPISGTMCEDHASNTPPNFWPFPLLTDLGRASMKRRPRKAPIPLHLNHQKRVARGSSGEVGGGSHLGHQQLWADMGFLSRCGHILPFTLHFEQRAGNLQNIPKRWKFPCVGQFSPDWPKFPQKHKITRKSSEFPCSWQFFDFVFGAFGSLGPIWTFARKCTESS